MTLLRRWLPAFVFVITFAVHALSPVTTSTDSAWTFHVAASLLREHNADLDEYRSLMYLQLDYRLRLVNGHIYYYYPVATPLLVAPVLWIINPAYATTHASDFYTYLATHGPDERTARLEKIIASAVVALAAVFMYAVARLRLSEAPSLLVACIFSFSTSMWSTASRALWQHGPSVLFLTAALYLLLHRMHRTWAPAALGALLGFAYLIRPTNSVSIVFIGLYMVATNRRLVWLYVVGVLAVLIPYVSMNLATYGNILPPYSYQLFERMATPAGFGEALLGTLLSPNRGLLIFTPVFFFSIIGAYLSLRGPQTWTENLTTYILAIVVVHWIVTASFEDWGGAWSIGPRYFVDLTPYLVYLLIPIFDQGLLRRAAPRAVFVCMLSLSTIIQAYCAISPDPFLWNGKPQALVEAPARKWDWGDLQFLRGLCPGDPVEGRAPACWIQKSD